MKRHPVLEELTPDPPEPGQVVSGNPEISELTLLEAGDGATSGLWQLTPGVVTDTEVEESFMVITGRGRVIFREGGVLELAPGFIHHFQGGEETTWEIEETLLKAYWIR